MSRISPTRQKVLDFIRSEVGAGRGFPKLRAIADFMGWKNEASATDFLWALVKSKALQADMHARNPNFRLAG